MRVVKCSRDLIKQFSNRGRRGFSEFENAAASIVRDVALRGDAALFEYTRKFDWAGICADNIRVCETEIKNAYDSSDKAFLSALEKSVARVFDFHKKHKREGFLDKQNGQTLGFFVSPVEKAGIYVPGGTAAYPSSVVMNAVPALAAGVPRVILCTPPDENGAVNSGVLAAARLLGLNEIYKIGGAQAIAAMAYGTESVPSVDKITGPGNIYVASAKRAVFGVCGVDSVAGPSEILIIADGAANPEFIAADLLSQAEHDELASAVLVTVSETLLKETLSRLDALLSGTPREAIARKSLEKGGMAILADSIDEAFEASNAFAPEHLEICVLNPFEHLPKVKNAGAVFLGAYAPEAIGDYLAGPNHILPTNGTARFFSPLSTDDFLKKTSVIHFEKSAFSLLADDCARLAEAEGLFAHARAVKARSPQEPIPPRV